MAFLYDAKLLQTYEKTIIQGILFTETWSRMDFPLYPYPSKKKKKKIQCFFILNCNKIMTLTISCNFFFSVYITLLFSLLLSRRLQKVAALLNNSNNFT